jgi:hypothetical protein
MHKISSVKDKPVEILRVLALAQFGALLSYEVPSVKVLDISVSVSSLN